MTEIKPSEQLRNQDKLKDITSLVFSVMMISPSRQEYYHDLHQNNFIHIL